MPKFVVNGKTYASLDEMPPEVRQAYDQAMGVLRDENQNGIPDILEGKTRANVSNFQTTLNLPGTMQIVADGKTYKSVDEMPADARIKYDQAMAKLGPLMSDANGNGIPDVFEGKQNDLAGMSIPVKQSQGMGIPAGMPQNPPPSVISEVPPIISTKAVILLAALVFVILVGVGAYLLISFIN
jgi:hypothetical protein